MFVLRSWFYFDFFCSLVRRVSHQRKFFSNQASNLSTVNTNDSSTTISQHVAKLHRRAAKTFEETQQASGKFNAGTQQASDHRPGHSSRRSSDPVRPLDRNFVRQPPDGHGRSGSFSAAGALPAEAPAMPHLQPQLQQQQQHHHQQQQVGGLTS